MGMGTRFLRAVCLCLWPAWGWAQSQPLLTEPAGTAQRGTLAIETGLDLMHSEVNFLTGLARDRLNGPLVRIVYSPADTAELEIEGFIGVFALADPTYGTVADFGDITLRSKLRLLQDREHGLTYSVRCVTTWPETAYVNGLGLNVIRTSVQGLVSKSSGLWRLDLNAGLAVHDKIQQAHAQRDFLAYGLAVTRRLPQGVEALGEVAGLIGHGSPGADERSELRLGARMAWRNLTWSLALRRSLVREGGTWGVTVGLAWPRPPRPPVPEPEPRRNPPVLT